CLDACSFKDRQMVRSDPTASKCRVQILPGGGGDAQHFEAFRGLPDKEISGADLCRCDGDFIDQDTICPVGERAVEPEMSFRERHAGLKVKSPPYPFDLPFKFLGIDSLANRSGNVDDQWYGNSEANGSI